MGDVTRALQRTVRPLSAPSTAARAAPNAPAPSTPAPKPAWVPNSAAATATASTPPQPRDVAPSGIPAQLTALAGTNADEREAALAQLTASPQVPESVKRLLARPELLTALQGPDGKELTASLSRLAANPNTFTELGTLAKSPPLRALLPAALGDAFATHLQQAGLSTEDFVAHGPSLLKAFTQAATDWKSAAATFADVANEPPGASPALTAKFLEQMPAPVAAQFSRLGLSKADLANSGPALGALSQAAEAWSLRNFSGAAKAMASAAKLSPGLAGQVSSTLGAWAKGNAGRLGEVQSMLAAVNSAPAAAAGTTEANVENAAARPQLEAAAAALAKGDVQQGLGQLALAFKRSPDASMAVMQRFVGALPSQLGPVKDLLSKPAVLQTLITHEQLHQNVGQLIDPSTRQAALTSLLQNETSQEALLRGLGDDASLERTGLTSDEFVRSAKPMVSQLGQALKSLAGQDYQGGLSALSGLQSSPVVGGLLLSKLTRALPEQSKASTALRTLGLTPEVLERSGKALPSVLQVAQAVTRQDFAGALEQVKTLAQQAPDSAASMLQNLATRLPEKLKSIKAFLGDGGVAKELVTNPTMQSLLPKLFSAGQQPEVLKALLSNDTTKRAAMTSFGVTSKLGISADDAMAESAAAQPLMQQATAAFAEGNVTTGLKALHEAMLAAPASASGLAATIAAKLPGKLANTKALLQNRDFVTTCMANASLKGSVSKVFDSKTQLEGLAELLGNEKARSSALGAVGSLDGMSARLTALGLQPDSLVKLGSFAPGALTAATSLARGDLKAALDFAKTLPLTASNARTAIAGLLAGNSRSAPTLRKLGLESANDVGQALEVLPKLLGTQSLVAGGKFGEAFSGVSESLKALPEALTTRILDSLLEQSKLPGRLKEPMRLATKHLHNPEVMNSFNATLGAAQTGDLSGLATNLITVAEKVSASGAAGDANSMLNAFGKMKGSLGKIFQDPQLNQSLVSSGSASAFLGMAKHLAAGHVDEAVKGLLTASKSLAVEGQSLKLSGVELGVSKQGLENLGRAFGRFQDALPTDVKHKLERSVAELAAKSGLKAFPLVGNVANGYEAVEKSIELYQSKSKADTVAHGFALTSLGLSVAGVVPALNTVVSPLQMGVGVAQKAYSLGRVATNIKEFMPV